MHCQLVNNLHGQYFVMVRHHHWPPDIPRQPPVPIDDEWGARIFIHLLDVDARQWRHWVDSTQVDPRLDEIAFTAAAIRELARGQFSIYPIQQEAFLRTIPKACTFQNHRDPDDEQHEYAIIPPTVALVKPGYDPVPLLVARRLLQAWTATADIEQLKQMLTLLQLPHATTAPVAALITALLEGLNVGGICLVRFRRRSMQSRSKVPEFVPYVHRPVPLGPPESKSVSVPKRSGIKSNKHQPVLGRQNSTFLSGNAGNESKVEWIKPSERTEQYSSAVVEVMESEYRFDFDKHGNQITRRGVYREEFKSLMGAGNLVERVVVGRGRRVFPVDFAVKVRTTGEQVKYVRYERSLKMLVKHGDDQKIGDTEILNYGNWRRTADVKWLDSHQLELSYPVKLSACMMACFTDLMK